MSADTQRTTFIITREDLTGVAPTKLVTECLQIGSGRDCHLRLNHPSVSSLHAGINEARGRFSIFVFNPLCNVTVNGRKGKGAKFAGDGDVVGIGPFFLHLQHDGHALHVRVSLEDAPLAAKLRERADDSPVAKSSCPHCGSPVPNDSTFCLHCGGVVARAESAPPRTEAAPRRGGSELAAGGRRPTPPPDEAAQAPNIFQPQWQREVQPVTNPMPSLGSPYGSSPRDEDFNARLPHPPQSFVKSIGKKLHTLVRRATRRAADCDPVDCTAFSPPTVKRGETFMVQVFAHRPEQTRDAREMAEEFDSATARRGFTSLEAEVRRGAKLTIHLSLPDFRVADPVRSLTWRGRPESVQFSVSAPAQTSRETAIGTVTVSEDGVPLGHVKFKIAVAEAGENLRANISAGEAARRYRKAFISYATQDRAEVLKRVQMLARLKIKFFQDVLDLEPGARWEQQLYRHIDESDLFLLFWSSAAQQSEWVLNEVRYALARKRDDDTLPPEIIPVIIEGPPPVAPPQELSHLHFNDYLVYFMAPPNV